MVFQEIHVQGLLLHISLLRSVRKTSFCSSFWYLLFIFTFYHALFIGKRIPSNVTICILVVHGTSLSIKIRWSLEIEASAGKIASMLTSLGNSGLGVVATTELWNLTSTDPSFLFSFSFFDKVKFCGLKWLGSRAVPLVIGYLAVMQ